MGGGGGQKLPLLLKGYMKCEASVTNFRLDYTYQPGVFPSASKQPSLTKLAFSLPVDGGVQNAVTRPTGKWSAEGSSMTWVVGEVPPTETGE